MKTILVPIDFSELSPGTAHFGLALAQRLNARLVLLHVVLPSPPAPAMSLPIVELDAWHHTLLDQTETRLQQFQEHLTDYQRQHKLGSVPVRTRLLVGQPVDTILTEAAAERASFIVMGTVGAATAWDRLVGSVASAVAQRADRPVWILPQAVTLDTLRQFVYFADLEGREINCIRQVINLGEHLHARAEVVHLSPAPADEFLTAEMLVEAFENTYSPGRVVFRHLMVDSVQEGIEDYVRSHQPDAVVLAHRNRGFIEKLFHHSQIRQLSLTTKRPLLIIPKPE